MHRTLRLWSRKYVPKTQCLVPSTSNYRLAVRRNSQVEDTEGVAGQSCQLRHRRVTPYDYLVLTVAVSANDLVHIFRPDQVANLTASIYTVQSGVRGGIPEADAAIGGSTSGGKKPVLVWGPGNCLDSGSMLCELEHGLR